MIRSAFITLFGLLLFCRLSAQAPSDSVQKDVRCDPKLKVLVSKHNEVMKKGQAQGYRVQIYFGSDRTKAKEVKTKFLSSYGSEAHAYEIYEIPNFKIRVGDFRTRLEAYRFLKKIRGDFPASFIVASKIEMPAVK